MAKYETAQDRKRQERASRLFCHAFDLVSVDRGEYAPVDYDLVNKQQDLIGALEVKGCPDRNIDDDLVVQVAIRKLVDLQNHQKKTNRPVAICWAFDDGIVYERISNLFGNFRLGGRKPRAGSYNDIEIMARIEIKNLKKVLY